MDKKTARAEALLIRKQLDTITQSKLLVNEIIESKILEKYNKIGIYFPLKNEINIIDIMNHYLNKEFYLPITRDILYFSRYKIGDKLLDGPFRTKEPNGVSIDINMLDCVIIPCVAIDKNKRRIGYGKGYYDKTLANFKGFKIGVCHKELIGLDIEMEDFDLVLDYVL